MDDIQNYELTSCEAEVWCLKQTGLTHQAIAEQLQMAEATVKNHVSSIQVKRNAELTEQQPIGHGLLDVGFWINLPD
ncbi:MAG: response regulator transcription factor [Leptolyngbyaceae cyanobacterium CRU_2_3]|nr:response regulator transcription factor [Leptolyngbyaceae cyanobacterium CRU_2_3]